MVAYMYRIIMAALMATTTLPATAADPVQAVSPEPMPVSKRFTASEADQGVASDGTHVYAIDNNAIGKYDIATGRKTASWEGDPDLFPHMNSCTVVGAELVCAASNYPAVPHLSTIEFFTLDPLDHVRTVSLGFGPGSLTVLDRHDGGWWAVYANYDGKGGVPGRGHAYTILVRMDDDFHPLESWGFPADVLARMAPYSASGASWGADGLLYVTGHDRPEVYALALPEAGGTLRLVATHGIDSEGQAIDWDPDRPDKLWSISRDGGELILSDFSAVRKDARSSR